MKRPAPLASRRAGASLAGSPHARKMAAAVLQALAGVTTPRVVAASAGISLQRFYALEARGLAGLVAALEPRPRGRQRTTANELARLAKDNARLTREVGRLATLVRAANRGLGLAEPKPQAKHSCRRRRRPVARALKALESLRADTPVADTGEARLSGSGASKEV